MQRRLQATRQRGTAIITALLVVLLAASVAAFLLAQQSHALTRTARATERAQAMLFVQPLLQWARASLFEFQKNTKVVDLTQRWAKPIGAQPIEGALATGFFRDESGLFNVNNLVNDDGRQNPADVAVFKQLLANLELNPDLASAIADWIDKDDETSFPGGAEDQTYLALPQPYRAANQRVLQIEELHSVRGIEPATFNKLKPFITALPTRSKININTAPREILEAAFAELNKAILDELLVRRMSQPFKSFENDRDIKGIKAFLKDIPPARLEQLLDFNSSYFSVSMGISTGSAQLRQSALFQLQPANAAAPNATASPRIIWLKDD